MQREVEAASAEQEAVKEVAAAEAGAAAAAAAVTTPPVVTEGGPSSLVLPEDACHFPFYEIDPDCPRFISIDFRA